MIRLLGTLKGVSFKSKVGDDGIQVYHYLDVKLELHEGMDRVQEVAELLKQIAIVEIEPKQKSLMEGQ